MTVRILCIDDDKDGCDMICVFLNSYNPSFVVTPAHSKTAALKAIESEKFDVYIIDNWLDGVSGVELCREIRITDKVTPVILYSAIAGAANISQGLDAGADAYLLKPNDLMEMGPTIEKLVIARQGQVGMVP